MACRDEFKLLAIRGLSEGDGLKPPITVAPAPAGQSQGRCERKENKGAQTLHGDLLAEL
jgi:hypothetical protein